MEGSTADLPQVKQAIDGARALLPVVEPRHGEQLAPVRDALSRLQMAYVQQSGGRPEPQQEPPPPQQPPQPQQPQPGQAGPAQKSGRLWVPGQ